MAAAGRRARVWPTEPFDGFRGEPWDVYYRVLELGQYPSEGEGFHYKTLASSALRLAIAEHPDGPPRQAGALIERLDLEALKAAHGAAVERELNSAQTQDVRRRYAAIFGPLRGGADGDWSFEDAGAAYVLIERQRMGEQAPAAARFFFEDFGHFFTSRKDRERPVLLVVDELTALAERGGLASRTEQARGFNTALVLCPQSAAGMGPEDEAKRIRDAVGLTILHQVNDPELLAQAAGTRMALEYSQHYAHGLATREARRTCSTSRRSTINEARSLAPGVAFLIRRGLRMKAKMAPRARGPSGASHPGAAWAGGGPAGRIRQRPARPAVLMTPGLGLYAASLALELPGAFVRTWLVALLAALGLWLAGAEVDPVAGIVGIAAGAAPLAWSLLALAWPGRGLWWRWRSGGREPSERERVAYEDALELLADERGAPPPRTPRRWFALDREDPEAAVRGDALMLSRGLLQRGGTALPAVLAHELGHTGSIDGRLTEALNRLVLWGDPIGPDPRVGRLGLVRLAARVVLWAAGGGLSLLLLGPLWAAHWRRREYAADARAQELGQGDDLARFLDTHALFFDVPVPFPWLSERAHPPVELRIDRLRAAQEAA